MGGLQRDGPLSLQDIPTREVGAAAPPGSTYLSHSDEVRLVRPPAPPLTQAAPCTGDRVMGQLPVICTAVGGEGMFHGAVKDGQIWISQKSIVIVNSALKLSEY